MADVIKKIDRGIPRQERYMVLTNSEVNAGDIIRVQQSLGRPANKVTIEATAAMTVRFNVYQMVFPERSPSDGFRFSETGLLNLAKGAEHYAGDGLDVVSIGAGETFELDGDISVKDLEVTTTDGAFEIFLT